MDFWQLFLGLVLLLSLQVNGFLFFKWKRAQKQPQPTLDAQRLLASIAGGDAVIRITVIDPADFFLKSPRG